jgi:alanyl-tRNA synthetase
LGDGVTQRGSNITAERVRFDFTHHEKVSREILDKVEDYVNEAIESGAKVVIEEMPKEQAKESGAVGAFWEKYPDVVTVYTIKNDPSTDSGQAATVYSRELCGGPHVESTTELAKFGKFKIKKESSSSAGVRRVKAVFVAG